MYNQVSMLPVTGVGTAASGAAAYTVGGPWFWVFAALAVFTLIGAIGAFGRTMPALSALYREPKQLAPSARPQGRSSFVTGGDNSDNATSRAVHSV
jgi:amino acid transporter